jgi:hypothetical protein
VLQETLHGKETVQEFNRGCFGYKSFTTKGAAEGVHNDNITGLAIETNIH